MFVNAVSKLRKTVKSKWISILINSEVKVQWMFVNAASERLLSTVGQHCKDVSNLVKCISMDKRMYTSLTYSIHKHFLWILPNEGAHNWTEGVSQSGQLSNAYTSLYCPRIYGCLEMHTVSLKLFQTFT